MARDCSGATGRHPRAHLAVSANEIAVQPGHANDLLDRQTVVGQAPNRLVSLLTAQDPLVEKPFGHGQQARIDCMGTERLLDLRHRTTYSGKKGLRAIVEQMSPVRDLDGVRQSPGYSTAITTIAVAGHGLDPGMAGQPSFNRCGFAVRQDIDDPPPFQIADQSSVTPPAAPSPIVDPDRPEVLGCAT